MAIGEFLTTADVAEELALSESRVRQFVMDGRLSPIQKIGQVLFFTRESVRDFSRLSRPSGRPKKTSRTSVDKGKRKR